MIYKGTDLDAYEASLVRQLAEVQKAKEALASLGDEPDGEDEVICWRRTFNTGGREYAYAAIRVPETGKWYVTGATERNRGYTWAELVAEHLLPATEVWRAAEWVAVK